MAKPRKIIERLVPDSLRSPEFPRAKSYQEVINYLIEVQQVQIRYHKIVLCIGIFGLLFSACWFCLLYKEWGREAFTQKEFFPSAIWSIFVMAFSGMELELRKKGLYELMRKRLIGGSPEDALDLLKNMKDLTWEEFKNLYK